MIIDAHTHIFPDAQAKTILANTCRMFNVRTYGSATASDLLNRMDENGISFSVIHMVAPGPSAVRDLNTWLIKLNQDRFIKFATLHPLYKDYRSEISRLKDTGVQGVKFQPDVQGFYPDDKKAMYPLYETLARKGLKVMFHVGGEPLPSPDNRSRPDMIARIADDFPELVIIGAHLGGLNMWDDVYRLMAGKDNIYLESSLSYPYIKPQIAEKIMRKHGIEKIFFGTDYPFASITDALTAARAVPFLTPEEKHNILGKNALAFFSVG